MDEPIRRLTDEAPVPIWAGDPTGACVYVNRCWLEFTGRRLEQERGHGWLEGVHPDDLDRCLAAHQRALAVRGALRVDYRLRVADAHYRRVAQSGLAQSDARGRFEGYVTALLDVTGREDAEQTLQRSKALRFAAFQSLPGEVVVIAKDGRVVAMNGSRGAGEAPKAAEPDAPSLGSNYRSACRRAAAQGDGAAQGVLQGIEAVLTGGQARFVLEYARLGRVEIWRGGVRFSRSLCAGPFGMPVPPIVTVSSDSRCRGLENCTPEGSTI